MEKPKCLTCEHFAWWDGDYCCFSPKYEKGLARLVTVSEDGTLDETSMGEIIQFAKESCPGGYSEQKKEIEQDLNDFVWRDYLLNKDRAATLLTTGCIIHSDEGDGEPWERFCLEIDFKDGKDEWEKLKQAGFKEGDKVRIKIEKIKP